MTVKCVIVFCHNRDSEATAPAEFPPDQPEADLNDDGVIYGAEESELEAALQRELKETESRSGGNEGEDHDMDGDNLGDDEDDEDEKEEDEAGSVDLEQSSEDEDEDDEEGEGEGEGEAADGDIEMGDDGPSEGQHTGSHNPNVTDTVVH